MVSFIDFIAVNLYSIVLTVLAAAILSVCLVYYSRTKHIGFLVLIVGNLTLIIWSVFYIFILQGALFVPNLVNSGLTQNDVVFIIFIVGAIDFVVSFINGVLIMIGLVLLGSSLSRKQIAY